MYCIFCVFRFDAPGKHMHTHTCTHTRTHTHASRIYRYVKFKHLEGEYAFAVSGGVQVKVYTRAPARISVPCARERVHVRDYALNACMCSGAGVCTRLLLERCGLAP